jgi:hypothetical protein
MMRQARYYTQVPEQKLRQWSARQSQIALVSQSSPMRRTQYAELGMSACDFDARQSIFHRTPSHVDERKRELNRVSSTVEERRFSAA